MIYIQRRELLLGLGAVAITTSSPIPIPNTAVKTKVVCETTYDGKQYVVFEDKPTTIYIFSELAIAKFNVGEEYLV